MSTVVICGDCDRVLERYEDGEPFREVIETCERCERDRYAAEYEAARDEFEDAWWG